MIYERPMLDRLYRRSPVFVQNMLLSGYGLLRLGEQYSPQGRALDGFLARTQWWSASEIAAWQDAQLRDLMGFVFEHVPYYGRLMRAARLRPEDFRGTRDLPKLPVLTKDIVRTRWQEIRCTVKGSPGIWAHTGGTSGQPMRFLLDRRQYRLDHALTRRHWGWAGFSPGQRVVYLRGGTLTRGDLSRDLVRRDWSNRSAYLSGFHLGPDSADRYRRILDRLRPQVVAAYPSLLFYMARLGRSRSIHFPTAMVSSEEITPTERLLIEGEFGCRVWDRYGAGERLVVAQQCTQGVYHQAFELGIVEAVDSAGQPVGPGLPGRVLGTTLTNRVMPLIRYDQGDEAVVESGRCACGRETLQLRAIRGRRDDVIVTADGSLMPRAGLDQVYEHIPAIVRCQLVQTRPGEVQVRVQTNGALTPHDRSALLEQLRQRLGCGTRLEVVEVSEIRPESNGKWRFIVSSSLHTGERVEMVR